MLNTRRISFSMLSANTQCQNRMKIMLLLHELILSKCLKVNSTLHKKFLFGFKQLTHRLGKYLHLMCEYCLKGNSNIMQVETIKRMKKAIK